MAEQEIVATVCRYVGQAYFKILEVKRAPAVGEVVHLAMDMAKADQCDVAITEEAVIEWWSGHRDPMPLVYLGDVHGEAQVVMFPEMTEFPNLLSGVPIDLAGDKS